MDLIINDIVYGFDEIPKLIKELCHPEYGCLIDQSGRELFAEDFHQNVDIGLSCHDKLEIGLSIQLINQLVNVTEDGVFIGSRPANQNELNNREIVMTAVTQDDWALNYASDELKNDREFVMAAVTQRGNALEYASERLKNDREIIIAAAHAA